MHTNDEMSAEGIMMLCETEEIFGADENLVLGYQGIGSIGSGDVHQHRVWKRY